MNYGRFCLYLYFLFVCTIIHSQEPLNYFTYHQQITKAETLASDQKFNEALTTYEKVFTEYKFVFVRDYKIAAQLALHMGNHPKAIHFIKKGMEAGWTLKSIKKNKLLKQLKRVREWNDLKRIYPQIRATYWAGINMKLREQVQLMFKKDQRKALGALFRIGDKAKTRYSDKQFAPHSENQMVQLLEILYKQGYPGEKSIGNDYWVSTIMGHHNSISKSYVQKDTLFTHSEPYLLKAIETGQMSPYEYALITDWRIAVLSNHDGVGYGFLNPTKRESLDAINQLRNSIGLRTIELRNKLVDIQDKTRIDFYLPDWLPGKINVE